jgi:hypothetical protein
MSHSHDSKHARHSKYPNHLIPFAARHRKDAQLRVPAWTFSLATLFIAFIAASASAQTTTPSIPTGETHKYAFTSTKIFPGTVRDY